MTAHDLKLVNDDLYIYNGDFVCAPSDEQHIQDIINAGFAWWKEFPQVGVNIMAYKNSTGKNAELKSNIQLQLIADGYQVNQILVVDSMDISVDAIRIK